MILEIENLIGFYIRKGQKHKKLGIAKKYDISVYQV